MEINLKEQWQSLAGKYTTDGTLVQQLWKEVEAAYTAPGRHYHNLHHIEYMLEQLRQQQEQLHDFDAVAFAVFYHDIIYSPSRSDNEEQSASRAAESLGQLHVPEEKTDACARLILATKAHEAAPDPDANYLIDSDLAILGEAWPLYTSYTQSIRKEYSLYPDFLYRKGRRKVLNHFLNMDRIFKTEPFFRRYEKQARSNISAELKRL